MLRAQSTRTLEAFPDELIALGPLVNCVTQQRAKERGGGPPVGSGRITIDT